MGGQHQVAALLATFTILAANRRSHPSLSSVGSSGNEICDHQGQTTSAPETFYMKLLRFTLPYHIEFSIPQEL
jgi:hypothetical protein